MIISVAVEKPNDPIHAWYACRYERRDDLRWRCGACMQGFVSPSRGEKCSRCKAEVKSVQYDQPAHGDDLLY